MAWTSAGRLDEALEAGRPVLARLDEAKGVIREVCSLEAEGLEEFARARAVSTPLDATLNAYKSLATC